MKKQAMKILALVLSMALLASTMPFGSLVAINARAEGEELVQETQVTTEPSPTPTQVVEEQVKETPEPEPTAEEPTPAPIEELPPESEASQEPPVEEEGETPTEPPLEETTEAPAEEETVQEVHPWLTFEVREDGLVVVSCDTDCEAVTVPAEFGGLPVLGIAKKAFRGCEKLENVTLSEGILFIESEAFADCEALTEISLPETLEEIAGDAFDGCLLLQTIHAPEESLAYAFGEAWLLSHPMAYEEKDEEKQSTDDQPVETETTPSEEELPKEEELPAEEELTEEEPLPEEEPSDEETISDEQDETDDSLSLFVLPTLEEPDVSLSISGPTAVGTGKSITLLATVSAETRISYSLVWSISDPSVATIRARGTSATITANRSITQPTEVTVTASMLQQQKPVTASWTLQVMPLTTKLTLTAPKTTLDRNDPNAQIALVATVTPANASKDLTWKSSNTAVATVDQHGVVTPGTKDGMATITATATDGSKKSTRISIKVEKRVAQFQLSGATELAVKKSTKLVATFDPADAKNKTLIWQTSDRKIATVSGGTVRGVAAGTVVITATLKDDPTKKVEWPMQIIPQVSSVTISGDTTIDLNAQSTVQLSAAVLPASLAQKATWKSSNAKVATVDDDGLVTILPSAAGKGTVTITATATDGSGKKDTHTITFLRQATGITIGGTTELVQGKSTTLQANVVPSNASNKTVTWSSSNTAVLTVNSRGVVSAARNAQIGESAQITATTKDGNIVSAPHTITLIAPKGAIEILGDAAADLSVTNSIQLSAVLEGTQTPANVSWKSSNRSVTVDANGLVTATKAASRVVITATATDGSGEKATKTLTFTASVTGVEAVGDTDILLAQGASVSLVASVVPSTATDKTLTWTSQNTAVATVSRGKVSAKGVGSTVIEASKGDHKVSFNITVTRKPTSVMITAERNVINLNTGVTTLQLTSTVLPADAHQTVMWASSNQRVATVDPATGLVTAVAAGSTTITATAVDGSKRKASFKLTVVAGPQSITITGADSATGGEKLTLTATMLPAGVKQDPVWSSSNTAVATVNSRGLVTTKKVNAATDVVITVSSKQDPSIKAEHVLTVRPSSTQVEIITEKYVVAYDTSKNTLPLEVAFTPAGSAAPLTWLSSNPSVATVDENGVVTGISLGQAIITASINNTIAARKTIYVVKGAQSIAIGGTKYLGVGKSSQLSATVQPAEATQYVTWSSSDTSVATVDPATGVVTASASISGTRTVTITATSDEDESIKQTHSITVRTPITGLTLNVSQMQTIDLSASTHTLQLNATVQPAGATTTIVWSSSNPAVAQVDAAGKVTALAQGSTTITATSGDGSGCSASVDVQVTVSPKSVSISGQTSLRGGASMQLNATVLPAEATERSVSWSVVEGDSVASISEDGLLTTQTVETNTRVTVKATVNGHTGIFAQHSLTLVPAVASISLEPNETILLTVGGEPSTVTATVLPAQAVQQVAWSSSNPEVASVNENGVVTPNAVGNANIRATAQDGSDVFASIRVSVIGRQSYAYELTSGGIRLTQYSGNESNVEIPETLGGRTVVSLGEGLFMNNLAIETLSLPESITVIPADLCNGCKNLTTVSYSDDVTTIGGRAFKDCTALKDTIIIH